jgi:hypothetical protein
VSDPLAERVDPAPDAPQQNRGWKLVGPGIVVAATGVGAGDLVATLIAGSEYAYALLWAVVLGVVVKIALAEAVGRWHLATGSTIFAGWRSLGVAVVRRRHRADRGRPRPARPALFVVLCVNEIAGLFS